MAPQSNALLAAVALTTLAAAPSLFAGAVAGPDPASRDLHTTVSVASAEAPVLSYQRDGRILSLYGRPMMHGATPQSSADRFVERNVGIFGVTPEEVRPGVEHNEDDDPVKGIMYDHDTGAYRKSVVRYTQHRQGVPVFRSSLAIMVHHGDGNPVVMASANIRPIGDFDLDAARRDMMSADASRGIAETAIGEGGRIFGEPRLVIFAGANMGIDVPRLAMEYVVERGQWPNIETYEKWLYVVDVNNGQVLYRENKVLNVDVEGNVSAYTTDGTNSDPCSTQSLKPLPYARVTIGATEAFADENGDFVIPNGGMGPVTVDSMVEGRWFRTNNLGGAEALLSLGVTPPGPANFEHNPSGSEFTTAEVNSYLEAQLCRDYILGLDPDFPIFDPVDEPFRIDVNDSGTCNAFYQGTNLLFLRAAGAGGCPNTAYSSIVFHEYGHHIVANATGSQCQWGEGNSDVCAAMVTDEPELAFGFFGDCNTPLRNSDNDCQYDENSCSSCGGPCHNCGQLISGCVWDLRTELLATEPADYRTITGQLWLASLFAHMTESEITPQVTIDYLMADDDDENIDNGTPHYNEIATAFGAHNMPAPPLVLLVLELPDGAPGHINPDGTTTVRLVVTPFLEDPAPDSGVLYVDDGNGVQAVAMVEGPAKEYTGTFPGFPCGTPINYYFSVDTEDGDTIIFPRDADDDATLRFRALAVYGIDPGFVDDFEEDLGWSVSGDATRGIWERVTPNPDCDQGNATTDGDGSGMCYVTEDGCQGSDVDNGSTTLTSPILDASSPESVIQYYRWYDNFFSPVFSRDDVLIVEVSDDGGASWTALETVGPEGEEADGGWFLKQFRVADHVTPNDQFRIRFIASDLGGADQVEAGVDGIEIINPVCSNCPEDLDGGGTVDFEDVLAVLAAWGPCGKDCPEDLDGGGTVDFQDVLAVLTAWGPCP